VKQISFMIVCASQSVTSLPATQSFLRANKIFPFLSSSLSPDNNLLDRNTTWSHSIYDGIQSHSYSPPEIYGLVVSSYSFRVTTKMQNIVVNKV
jgi:hypothetical protein